MVRLPIALSLGAALWTTSAVAAPVSTITQYGITWTFDKAYESGKPAQRM